MGVSGQSAYSMSYHYSYVHRIAWDLAVRKLMPHNTSSLSLALPPQRTVEFSEDSEQLGISVRNPDSNLLRSISPELFDLTKPGPQDHSPSGKYMDTLTASSVSSRPWVPQFFRNLFGSSRHVRLEGQGPKADAKEKEGVKSELLDSPLPDCEPFFFKNTEPDSTSFSEICEGVTDSHAEKLPGHPKEVSLEDTVSTTEKIFSSVLEKGDSDVFPDSTINKLAHDPTEDIPASDKKKGPRGTPGKDRISQALCADDEEVSTAARSLAVTAEEEREHLLKEDVRVEPPKAELSRWNRLINMYKQRPRLPATKVTHLQPIPAQPELEDEATVDLMIYGAATPQPHSTLADSSGIACVCGFPGNESGDLAGHCEIANGGSRSSDAESTLEHSKNIF